MDRWEGRKKKLQEELATLKLPRNPLDDLIDKLGGPKQVCVIGSK